MVRKGSPVRVRQRASSHLPRQHWPNRSAAAPKTASKQRLGATRGPARRPTNLRRNTKPEWTVQYELTDSGAVRQRTERDKGGALKQQATHDYVGERLKSVVTEDRIGAVATKMVRSLLRRLRQRRAHRASRGNRNACCARGPAGRQRSRLTFARRPRLRYITNNVWTAASSTSSVSAIPDQRLAIHVAFGAQLREARRRQRISQDELARRSGLHRTFIGGIERGQRNPSLTNIARLASALDVPVAELVEDLDERPHG